MKRFFIINLGVIIMVIGLHFFLIPAKLATGGLTGLAMLIHQLIPAMPVGAFMLIGNVLLFLLAFIMIGREFGGYTVYCSLALSGMVAVLEGIMPLPGPLVDDILLNLFYGTLIPGVGMAIIFYQNASTGGTDILAKILNRYFHIDIGKSLLLVDFFVVVGAAWIFGLKLGLYALMGLFLNSVVIDQLIAGFNSRLQMTILTKEWEELNRFILEELERGTTIYHAQGGYSKEEKQVVSTLLSKREYIRIKKFLKEKDPRALVSVHFVREVIGEGFRSFE